MLTKTHKIIIAIIVLLVAGISYQYLFTGKTSNTAANNASTQPFFAATFPDENSKPQALQQYAGKIVVLNFWATWCEPCREEMPELSELQNTYKDKNVVVLGVAADEIAAIKEFTNQTKVSYPLFAADMQGMDIASQLGNDKSVLPYTVIIAADGSVAKSYFGRVTKALLSETLNKLIIK